MPPMHPAEPPGGMFGCVNSDKDTRNAD